MVSVRSSADLGRLAAAASRPGIDPRQWILRAIVIDVAFDPKHGLFADVQFQPDGDIETVLVGANYSGDGFGEYWPIKVDDIVLVALSQGDPGDGGVIISRMFSGSEKPPKELSAGDAGVDGDVTTDPTLRIEDGATLRIVGKAGANYRIELDGNATYEIVGTGGTTVIIDGDAGVRLGKPVSPELYRGVARQDDSVLGAGDPESTPPTDPELAVPLLLWAELVKTGLAGVPFVLPPLADTIGSISSSSDKTQTE